MWESIVRRRSRTETETQYIELGEEDCNLLVAAGLKIQKGTSPRDVYCFQYLPSYYDGTPLQVLRLLEEVRDAGRIVRAEMEAAKRQRLHGEYTAETSTKSQWRKSKQFDLDVQLLEQDDDAQLPELIKIMPASAKKFNASPVKASAVYRSGRTTPVKPTGSPMKSGYAQAATPTYRTTKCTSMTVNVTRDEYVSAPSSARKRKSESSSPLAALLSLPIETPSPGLKTRRASVLKQFETPEATTDTDTTPQTAPAPPKRFSHKNDEFTRSITKSLTKEWEGDLSDDSHDELDDDDVDDDSRGCCDVKSVVEPVWDVLQRTSTRFQNVWEEYSKGTPTK